MAADKHASVHWEGAGKTGKGQVSTETVSYTHLTLPTNREV